MQKIEIFEAGVKGRGLKSKKDMRIGELIFKEDAYAMVVMNAYSQVTCHHCLASCSLGAGQPNQAPMSKCTGCGFARYCNRECQKSAWSDHKLECNAIKCTNPRESSDKTRMVARIVWKNLRDGAKTDAIVDIKDLLSHIKSRTEDEMKVLDDSVYDFGDFFGYDNLPEDEELLHMYSIIDCNAIGINDKRALQSIAVGVFPTSSLLNHDCNPNAVAINNGKRLEVRALQPIKIGEEITISYVDATLKKEDRLERLRTTYYFECTCKVCTEGCEADVLKDAPLSDEIEQKSIDYIEKFADISIKRIGRSKKNEDWERMSNQVLGTLNQMDYVLADTHVLKLQVLNHGVEVHSYLQRQAMAAEQASRVAEAYKKLLPKVHPVLGLFLMRLGILLWQVEKLDEALENLKASASIISRTHGEEHQIFNDLLGLIQQVQMEFLLPESARVQSRLAKVRAGHKLPQASM